MNVRDAMFAIELAVGVCVAQAMAGGYFAWEVQNAQKVFFERLVDAT